MAAKHVFYITQGSLVAWRTDTSQPQAAATFADDDAGIHDFAVYAANHCEDLCAILVDVIEEEFVHETIPKLGLRDRKTMIARRAERRFRQTPFRVSVCGKKANPEGEYDVIHSAITNHELVEPWLNSILRFEMSLTGIYSVPLIAPQVFRKLFKQQHPSMFIARHQGQQLRQVFMRDGQAHSARLSKAPEPDGEGFAQFIATEVARSRRYLERTRLLLASERLDICVVADADTEAHVAAAIGDSRVNQLQFLSGDVADQKLAVRNAENRRHCERWYVSLVAKKMAQHSYAVSAETRFWHMRKLRNAITTIGVTAGAVCSMVAALLLADAWQLRNRIADTHQQVELLSETFRRENVSYDSIQANSAEMKLAVDTGDYILANRVPVPWVMNQLGSVLSRYPDIRLRQLRWESEHPQTDNPNPRRTNVQQPRPIPQLTSVSAVIHAEILTFDGDMRAAFARIDELALDFERATDFDRAQPIEYPLNANTSSALAGEIDPRKALETAAFQIKVRYSVPGASIEPNGDGHEAI